MSELVLYGIRLLAKQFLGTVLDIEVDQSGQDRGWIFWQQILNIFPNNYLIQQKAYFSQEKLREKKKATHLKPHGNS